MRNYRRYQKAYFSLAYNDEHILSHQRTLALMRLMVVSMAFIINRHLDQSILLVLAFAGVLSLLIYFYRPICIWAAGHRYVEFFIDEILIFLVCFYSGGLHSPYIAILFLPLLVHAMVPISVQTLVVALVTVGNLFLIGVATALDWQLFINLAICLLLGAAFANILVYNDVQFLSTYAIHDGLTGLYSHQFFWYELRSMMRTINQVNFSLIMIDLDEFKRLNDEYGHLEGDRVLREVADTIKTNVRNRDTVARYGGDEFAILLPGTGPQMCRSVIDRLSNAIIALGYFDHVSIGSALYPNEADSAESLVNLADTRMYNQKRDNKKQDINPEAPKTTCSIKHLPIDIA